MCGCAQEGVYGCAQGKRSRMGSSPSSKSKGRICYTCREETETGLPTHGLRSRRIHPKWLTEQNPKISGISVTVATAEVVVCKQADSNSSIDFQQGRYDADNSTHDRQA